VGAVLVLHSLVPTLLFDPRRNGCFACPRNLLGVVSEPSLHEAVVRWGLRALLTVGAVLAALALYRWSGASHGVRVATALVVLPGTVAAMLGSLGAARALADPGTGFDPSQRAIWLAQCACVLVMGAGVAVRVALAQRLRDRVAGLVVDVLLDADRLRDGLAETLDDPQLSLAFPRDGRPVPDHPGRESVYVTRGDRVVAQVFHGPALEGLPDRVASAVQAAGLALEHAGEQARLRAELDELSELRTRIVATGDAERRRLERNLHDGAQQRLIRLAIALQSTRDPAPGTGLTTAAEEVRAALEELRAIAHGIHPVTLTDAGLSHALRALVEDASVPVRIESLPGRRFDEAAEATAYRVIADAVGCAELADPDAVVRVRVAHDRKELRAEVEVAGGDSTVYAAALAAASDRARAIGGAVHVRDGVLIELRTPCDS
jgi:signal transduction histidine kinase